MSYCWGCKDIGCTDYPLLNSSNTESTAERLLNYRRMADRLLVKPGDRLLDTGSGRGIIALNVATWTNTSVVGVNSDETQNEHARRLAFYAGMDKRLQFRQQGGNSIGF